MPERIADTLAYVLSVALAAAEVVCSALALAVADAVILGVAEQGPRFPVEPLGHSAGQPQASGAPVPAGQYAPAGHGAQVALEEEPVALDQVPAGQGVGTAEENGQ
jgi:hypothetical protein